MRSRPLSELAEIPVTRLKGVGEQKANGLGELAVGPSTAVEIGWTHVAP